MSSIYSVMTWPRRRYLAAVLAIVLLSTLVHITSGPPLDASASRLGWRPSRISGGSGSGSGSSGGSSDVNPDVANSIREAAQSKWAKLPHHYPVKVQYSLPSTAQRLPRVQSDFPQKSAARQATLDARLDAIRANFSHAWNGYKEHAWLKDEVAPISGGTYDAFGGWAATLVDSLGTLWIMGLQEEFKEAVKAIEKIDFTTCALKQLNVFETTIRYMGGFLSAYDLSEGKYPTLLTKAIELGEMLYHAFDTPNRMPVLRWDFGAAIEGARQTADTSVLVAEIGSLTLEFTRLSQITGDPKFFDAVQRVMDVFEMEQPRTRLPGMWPVIVNAKDQDFSQNGYFTLGGMADSVYEYLPKQHLLMGGATDQYEKMYHSAMGPISKHIFWRPMTKPPRDALLAGELNVHSKGSYQQVDPQAQHLACFVGGMVGLGARLFSPDDPSALSTARKLVEGCLWAYESQPLGIMPEIFHAVPCADKDVCTWDEAKWLAAVTAEQRALFGEIKDPEKEQRAQDAAAGLAQGLISSGKLAPGVTKVDDTRYILRPEAIESVFYLYRMTGEEELQERAWKMFENIVSRTQTDIAHAGLDDCTKDPPPKQDKMESFWLAETLRYFYLIFADEQLISLDEYVLNTEAHPLRRPSGAGGV